MIKIKNILMSKRAVISAILILVICAIVAYNFEDIMTGFVAQEELTKISVNPDKIYAGETLNVKIMPGISGARKYVTFHSYPSNLRKGMTIWCYSERNCLTENCFSAFKCFEPRYVTYKTNSLWSPGVYFARVYDYARQDYVTTSFEILEPKTKLAHEI